MTRHGMTRRHGAARRGGRGWLRRVAARCGAAPALVGSVGVGFAWNGAPWRGVVRPGSARHGSAFALTTTSRAPPPHCHPCTRRTVALFQICVARDESVSTPVGCLCGALWMLVTLLGNGFCVGRGSARSESLHAHAHRMLIATSMCMYMCVNGSCVQVLPETAAKTRFLAHFCLLRRLRRALKPSRPLSPPQQAYQQIRAVSCNVEKRRDVGRARKGGYGDFEKLQPCKSDYTTSHYTYQTCPKRPR
jgi:hypothetical protein